MLKTSYILAATAFLGLSACLNNDAERALAGGLIGALADDL